MSKPRLPSDVRPGDMHDSRGVPIFVGDLIRTFHFRTRRPRKTYYLYHLVVDRGGVMTMVPVRQLATGDRDGGDCFLHTAANGDGVLMDSVVLDGRPDLDQRKRIPINSIIAPAGKRKDPQ